MIVSLVRSNKEEKVGFVKTQNRICVTLSRAKIGMYVIGNLEMLAKQSGEFFLKYGIVVPTQQQSLTGIKRHFSMSIY